MPFLTEHLDEYLRNHPLSECALAYVRGAADRPSRNVGTTTYRSVVCEYPSQKMGTSIVTESRTGEFAYAVFLEYDTDVVAYYEQPGAVDCLRTNRKGHRGTRLYHPDFLVLRRSGPVVVQVKSHEALVQKVLVASADWCNEGGRFRDLAADKAFATLGLVHDVIDSSELPKVRVANLQLLLQTRIAGQCDQALRRSILRALDKHAALRMSELAKKVGIMDMTPIVLMIDEGVVHTLIDSMLLSQPESCLISLSLSTLDALVSAKTLIGPVDIERIAPLLQTRRGIENLARVEAGETGRSIRRYKRAIAGTAKEGRSALEAVTPKSHRSGNRTRKRPTKILDVAEDFVRSVWGSALRLTAASFFRMYKAHAAAHHPGESPLSRKSLAAIVARQSQTAARARGGLRAGNAAESPTEVNDRAFPATRPFEIASCDHYLCDIDCVVLVSGTATYVARAWLTILKDCATGVLLAYCLSFRAPSRIACAIALRCCLRRHGRLPEGIVVDRGSEFRSVYFASLLAHCAVALIQRPSSHARYGSEAERFFGAYKSLWLNLRPGNSAIHHESRSVSSSHAASAHAALELCDLHREIEQFSNWSNEVVPNSGARAPGRLFDDGLCRFPHSGRTIPFDDRFLVASSVEEAKITLDLARGLQIGDPKKWYWSPALVSLGTRKKVEVRRDPEDETVVYARVSEKWEPCFSSGHAIARTQDPVVALCNSIISMTGTDARKEAKNAADIALVKEVALADAHLRAKVLPPPASTSVSDVAEDPFASLRTATLAPATVTLWEAT